MTDHSTEIASLSTFRSAAIVTITKLPDGGGLTAPCYAAVFISPAGLRTIVSETVAQQISEQLNIRFVTSDRAQSSRLGA